MQPLHTVFMQQGMNLECFSAGNAIGRQHSWAGVALVQLVS